ncbi:hypothetical protein B0H14DRAFT_3493652 [Mycena olivaceomarginata]|nr:hypothetical protein B0H14DRAFT_3493652 [Mycena olivaceomarginata]
MATPIRRFTQLQSQHSELTDSQLLNSNNQTACTGKADVVVAGAGIIGLMAWHWYKVDQEDREVTANDIGGLDISFQLDRRMSEVFIGRRASALTFTMAWRTHSTPSARISTLAWFCDASGFSRRLTSKFGARENFDSCWNTDAYWTYFREKDTSNVDGRLLAWNYPATKYICFPEGWGWFIRLISWHYAPLVNLMDLVSHVIASAAVGVTAEEFSCTRELSEMFACPYEFITSIGWAVRNDFKLSDDLSAYRRWRGGAEVQFLQEAYPVINTLLTDSFELLPGYYGGRTCFVGKGLAYCSPVVAGEGWLAIGNSAGFTNPLISPGINAGIGGSWRAANLTAEVLAAPVQEARTAMNAAAESHQTFMHYFMLPRLDHMNRMWYNAFRDHRLFEAVPRTLWSVTFRTVDNHYSQEEKVQFTEADARWGIRTGLDEFQALSAEMLDVLDGTNGGASPSEVQVQKVLAIMERTVRERTEMWPENHWGRWLREYDDKLQKVPGKMDRSEGCLVEAKRCEVCNYFVHNRADNCPICGEKNVWRRNE